MALPSHLYDTLQQHTDMLKAMGAPEASLAPITANLVNALGASPYAKLDLSAAAAPANEVAAQPLPNLRQASARSI